MFYTLGNFVTERQQVLCQKKRKCQSRFERSWQPGLPFAIVRIYDTVQQTNGAITNIPFHQDAMEKRNAAQKNLIILFILFSVSIFIIKCVTSTTKTRHSAKIVRSFVPPLLDSAQPFFFSFLYHPRTKRTKTTTTTTTTLTTATTSHG